MALIDLRSDTLSMPTPEMLQSIAAVKAVVAEHPWTA
jgi:threonine aldolase